MLNHRGSDTFQTGPGAILSMVMVAFMIVYVNLKFRALVENKDWMLE